jgi:hypothetical protein
MDMRTVVGEFVAFAGESEGLAEYLHGEGERGGGRFGMLALFKG